jgi:hypothetical protein
MGHCGGSNDDTPDEEAMQLAAQVVIWVGTHDPVMTRKTRDLGAHVMRMAERLEATRRVVNELRSKWYSEEGRASLALIAAELDRETAR